MGSQTIRIVIMMAVLATSLVAAAQTGMTPKQVAEIQTVTRAETSPDGTRVAVVRSVPRPLFADNDGTPWSELLVIDLATGGEQPFVTGEGTVSQVQWRPDGAAVSFVAERGDDEHASLYQIPLAGGEARRVLGMDEAILDYAWHPDGRRLAIVARTPEADGAEDLRDQGFTQKIHEEDFRHRALWLADLGEDAGEPTRLDIDGSVFQMRWHPDGDRLAVAVAPTPLVDDRYMAQRIHVIAAADAAVQSTVRHQGKLGDMRWSPDGKHLAFIAGIDLNDPADQSLFVVPAAGGSPKNLTDRALAGIDDFVWADADHLVALVSEGVFTDLHRVHRDGSRHTDFGLDDAGVAMTRISGSGTRLAAVASSPTHPAEAFTVDIANEATIRRLTTTNAWLDDVALADQEVVRWAARDGLELEGLLIRPLEADGPAPLVVVVHGGPEAHRSHGWLTSYSSPAQVLAARGVATFVPNYRGSTGRGVAFAKLGQKDAAGAEFDDVVDGVDHLIEIGVADPDRVGVTGGSYGGYATAWLTSTYSDRFAAGAMFVGISNKISKFGTTDIPNEEVLVHALRHPWDDWQFALERSPIYHAQSNRTPLLILHGEDDPRVSVTQSKEMFRIMKTLGQAPVRLVLYPGEGHGNRRAASRYDYSLRVLRWMEHYLIGEGGDPPPYQLDYKAPEHGWPKVEEDGDD
jgi:dipeptidyl aminopeptidase/acylaminoacyl peptidase